MIYKMRISAAFRYLFLPLKGNLLKTKTVVWISDEKNKFFCYHPLFFTIYNMNGNIFIQKGALSVAGQIMDSDFYLKETRRTTCK